MKKIIRREYLEFLLMVKNMIESGKTEELIQKINEILGDTDDKIKEEQNN